MLVCAFLAKKFAESNKIDAFWILTKTGHGKGPMYGVGAVIKMPLIMHFALGYNFHILFPLLFGT